MTDDEDKVIYGFQRYTEMEVGNMNILISVPHDGPLKPDDIHDREKDSNGNYKNDSNTRKVARVLREELSRLFSKDKDLPLLPFVIYNNLHRLKMDPNRDPTVSFHDSTEDSAQAYNDYHNMIETHFGEKLMENVETKFKQGLLVDLHGQSHKENWIELGYLISSKKLERNDLNSIKKQTSMNLLASQVDGGLESVIRGTGTSLGSILQDKFDIRSVPSPNTPSPSGANYYSGGYITDRYTSEEFSKYRLNAVQIELPSSLRDNATLEDTAHKLAACIHEFYTIHSFDD